MNHRPLSIYIGYDSREPAAFAVLVDSLIRHSTIPLQITPLALTNLPLGLCSQRRAHDESTEFSRTRFLVPYLSNYQGWSMFMDCDMVCQTDIAKLLFEILGQREKAVLVCQHDYVPKSAEKFLGEKQVTYPRKNWSSLMVFNNERCKALTPDYVNTATGQQLHRFEWTTDDCIGTLPLEWNWLAGEYEANPEARLIHYTNGGPWFGIRDSMSQLWDDAAVPIRQGINAD